MALVTFANPRYITLYLLFWFKSVENIENLEHFIINTLRERHITFYNVDNDMDVLHQFKINSTT